MENKLENSEGFTENTDGILKKKTEKEANKFFSGIKNRFLAFATAGFITLGGGWEKSLADQLKLVHPEKDNSHMEFVLETAVTDEKLQNFKERVSKEEPDFVEWLDNYSASLRKEMDGLVVQILNRQQSGQEDVAIENLLKERIYPQGGEGSGEGGEGGVVGGSEALFTEMTEKDHRTIAKIKKEGEALKQWQEFINSSLDDILWSIALIEDSKEVRSNMVELVNPPKIDFDSHDPRANDVKGYSYFITDEELKSGSYKNEKKWSPHIKIMPGAFELKDGTTFDLNSYINVCLHEIVHAMHPGSINKEEIVRSTYLRKVLVEGVTQNISFELVQYLETKKEGIKPIVGSLAYDVRLVVSAIVEGILRSTGGDSGALVKWHTGILSDNEMVEKLDSALKDLKLDSAIASDIKSLDRPLDHVYPGPDQDFKNVLTDMLARLKINGVKLSPEFLEAIIAKNRHLDDWQIQKFEKTIELGSINKKVDTRVKDIKNIKTNVRH